MVVHSFSGVLSGLPLVEWGICGGFSARSGAGEVGELSSDCSLSTLLPGVIHLAVTPSRGLQTASRDARTYESACALRIVESLDGMTADWGYLDRDLLRRISNRIINEVRGINRVVLDVSSKPPSTIEWE